MSLSPKELSAKLKARSREVVQHLFKGKGKFIGDERFVIGDIQGNPGESFVVFLRTGRFKDFALGSDKGGDLLQLFHDFYGGKEAGYDAAYAFLGIQKPIKVMTSTGKSERKKKIEWKKPEPEWFELTPHLAPNVWDYLVNERKLDPKIFPSLELKQDGDRYYVFLTYTFESPEDAGSVNRENNSEPVNCGAMFIDLERKEVVKKDGRVKMEKVLHQSTAPLFMPWGMLSAKTGVGKTNKKKGYLVVTAGQIDCLSLRSQGIPNCVSIPSGENDMKWIENSWEWLIGNYDEFYLLFDNDKAGEEYLEKVAEKIGYARCKKCYLPKKYNDANEAHIDGFNLHECIDKASDFKMDILVPAYTLIEDTIAVLEEGRREERGMPFLGWVDAMSVKFRIRPKEMTIISGYAGHGKSNAIYQEIAYLIFIEKQQVVLASLEEDPQVVNSLIAIHALGMIYDKNDQNKCLAFRAALEVIGDNLHVFSYRGTAKFPELIKSFEFAVGKYGVQHAVLDSIAKTDLNIEKNEEARQVVNTLCEFIDGTKCHLWVVAHPHKGDDRDYYAIPGFQQIKGDNAFGNLAFNVISLWKNGFKDYAEERSRKNGGSVFRSGKQGNEKTWNREEIEEIAHSTLYVSKQKVGGQVGKHGLYYNHENYRLHRTKDFSDFPCYASEIVERYIENPEFYAKEVEIMEAEEEDEGF